MWLLQQHSRCHRNKLQGHNHKTKEPTDKEAATGTALKNHFFGCGQRTSSSRPTELQGVIQQPRSAFLQKCACLQSQNREGLILETYLAWGRMVVLLYQEPKGDFLKSSCSLQPLPLMLKYKPRSPQLPRNLFCRNNMPAWARLRYLTANPSFQKIPLGRRIFSMTRAPERVATWHRRKLYNGQSLNWSRDYFKWRK